MAMLTALRDKWVAALRSGEYQQGCSLLRQNNQYCCLGVLCDISGLGTWIARPDAVTAGEQVFISEGTSQHLYLSGLLLDKLGISDSMQGKLSGMNDDRNSFNYIADYIEENVPVDS